MAYVTAYTALIEPVLGRLPVQESIESLYDHVDAFVVYDCSKYDKIDLSKYGKVKKHVKGIFNPFDNPFGSAFSQSLRLVDSDTALFLDADEIFEFRQADLRTLINQFPLEMGAGIAFPLLNYYCDRYHTMDGCSSKGAHVFKMRDDLYHDALGGYWKHHNHVRRTNLEPDSVDGVRLCNGQGVPMNHYQPVDPSVALIHHTSHLDPAGKHVRSIIQYNHTSSLDLREFYPFDMRLRPELIKKIISLVEDDIKNGDIELYGKPIPFDYKPVKLLEDYIKRAGIIEFDPTKVKDYERYKNEVNQQACITAPPQEELETGQPKRVL